MPVWKAVALHAWQVVGAGVTQCLSAAARNYLNGLDQCQQIQTAAVCLCFLLLLT